MNAADVVTDPTATPEYGGKVCRCGVCGFTGRCTPDEDFYVRTGETWLRCERCVCSALMPGALS